jgi:hypothetical protein
MANAILTNDIVLKLTLKNLINTLGTVKVANRQYEKKFIKGVGSTIRIANPVQFVGQQTSTIVNYEDIVETQTDFSINRTALVGITLDQIELSREVIDFNASYAKPIAIRLANFCNQGVMTEADLGFNSAVGSLTPISGYNPVDNLKVRLEEMSIDWEDMYCGMSPKAMGGVRQGQTNLFTPSLNDRIVMRGTIGEYDGFSMYTDQSIKTHTTGSMAGTPLVAGAGQSGTVINLDGFTANAANVLRAGDIISFAGVFAVNPDTKEPYEYLQQFNVQANVTASGTGTAAVTIAPAIDLTSPYQNVSALPADNAVVTNYNVSVNGTAVTYKKNLGFTKTGLAFAAPPRVRNPGAYYSQNMNDDKTGINMCLNIDYTTATNTNRYRFDVVYGAKAYANYGAILTSPY